jgi:hypothetical protein
MLRANIPKEQKYNTACQAGVILPSFIGAEEATPSTLIAARTTLLRNKIIGLRLIS